MADVEQIYNIPALVDLALTYGTISRNQHEHLSKLFALKKGQTDIETLMLDEGVATPYQLELLKLIRGYHIVRKSGEEFGKIAVEKGLATNTDISQALEIQKNEFKKSRHKKFIGDILVETRILTSKQKNLILKEQKQFSTTDDDTSVYEPSLPVNREKDRDGRDEQIIGTRICVSSDHMTAWMERNNSDEKVITLSQAKDAVRQYGIVNGVYPDSIIQCFLDANVSKFPIARIDCTNLLKRKSNLTFHITDDNGKQMEKKKGEILTEQADAAIEIQAENLYGEKINAVAENDFAVRCGQNTRWSKDRLRILAVKSGVPALSVDRSLYVHPVVHILEDADLRYGPIEPYANLSVAGAVTGAFPITAGEVTAEEIRGADIDALGSIHSRIGITGAVIRSQGDVHARYVHNSRIEAFGNVYIENEIIDSQIRCTGKIDSPKCRVISSRIYAKDGVILSGAGSERSAPSTIIAGGEQHAVGLVQNILDKMDSILAQLEALKDEKRYQQSQAEQIFKKMIELKSFHDKAKQKKDALLSEFNKKKESLNKKTLVNIQKLISTYNKRMDGSLTNLKSMNASKKEHDQSVVELEKQIFEFTVQAEKEILSHEKILFAFLEKAKEKMGVPCIDIKGTAYTGTILGGVYKILSITDEIKDFKVTELWAQGKSPELKIISRD